MFRALMRRLGFVHKDAIEDAHTVLSDLRDYADRSGHLSNGFHVGKRVKRGLDEAMRLLEAS